MRIAVVGAGAIGGFVAAALARSGESIAIVARGAHLAEIRRRGLEVESELGSFTVAVEASDDLRTLGNFDALLLSFKSHQWPDLLEQLAPFAGSNVTVVTLQNGLPFWFVREPPLQSVDPGGRIGALFSDSQTVGGVVHASGYIPRPGTVAQSGGMRYPLGEIAGGSSERVEQLADVMRKAGLAPEIAPDIRALVWSKLVNNSGLNPVSALDGLSVKLLLENPEARREVRALMEETSAIGAAIGVAPGPDIDARLASASRLNDVKTSMLQDVEARRPLELDPIVGALVELADRLGIPAPHLHDVYGRLRELERSW